MQIHQYRNIMLFNRIIILTTVMYFFIAPILLSQAPDCITYDSSGRHLVIRDGEGRLTAHLSLDRCCVIDTLKINGRPVVANSPGVYSGISFQGLLYTTQSLNSSPVVAIKDDVVTITNIAFGPDNAKTIEKWTFTVKEDYITWRIDRNMDVGVTIEETYMPVWNFDSINTWDGALLGNGGVAWCKLFDTENASYAVHSGEATFWNSAQNSCLRIHAKAGSDYHAAMKFSRQPDSTFSLAYSITDDPIRTKHVNYRFFADRQDIWAPITTASSKATVEYRISSLDYNREYDRGNITEFWGESVREILQTAARIGVIDSYLMGSNSWRTGYGPICLHEQYHAQRGLAINDPNYFRAMKNTLDYYRDNAIEADGRVISRWAYHDGDSMPGTYTEGGFYECQWGYLMDSNTDQVINVAELFDMTGDFDWVKTHKHACESALDYLIRRDSDNDCLVEMATDYHTEGKGSDWIDIIWASYENALVNAKLYYALTLWADIEELLGDDSHAAEYKQFAVEMKESFNRSTANGGFWEETNKWYVYWRDKDDSIHGNNLVTPVNFMAIAYGLCDDRTRIAAILDKIEDQMLKEKLFSWPLCMYSYEKDEGPDDTRHWPYPSYENGDIFLSWGEIAMRAYVKYEPSIAVKYTRKLLDKYEIDGLAFQRYLRISQDGAGDDILAGNAQMIVGLYRNIYGIQPKYNRLYIEPHMTKYLNGSMLRYLFRGNVYSIDLSVNDYKAVSNGISVRDRQPFALDISDNELAYFSGDSSKACLRIQLSKNTTFDLDIETWETEEAAPLKWTETCGNTGLNAHHTVNGLSPGKTYELTRNGHVYKTMKSDSDGCVTFSLSDLTGLQTFELRGQR